MTLITEQTVLNVDPEIVAYWRTLPALDLLQNADYLHCVTSLDAELLTFTFKDALIAYEQRLPEFQELLYSNYGVQHAPMFTDTIAKWVTAVIRRPHFMVQVVEAHTGLNPEIMEGGLPMMLEMLEVMGDGREEWQRAVYLLTLPLMLR